MFENVQVFTSFTLLTRCFITLSPSITLFLTQIYPWLLRCCLYPIRFSLIFCPLWKCLYLNMMWFEFDNKIIAWNIHNTFYLLSVFRCRNDDSRRKVLNFYVSFWVKKFPTFFDSFWVWFWITRSPLMLSLFPRCSECSLLILTPDGERETITYKILWKSLNRDLSAFSDKSRDSRNANRWTDWTPLRFRFSSFPTIFGWKRRFPLESKNDLWHFTCQFVLFVCWNIIGRQGEFIGGHKANKSLFDSFTAKFFDNYVLEKLKMFLTLVLPEIHKKIGWKTGKTAENS